MNSSRSAVYSTLNNSGPRNFIDPKTCPIDGNDITEENLIEFSINGKKIRVCCQECVVRVKNIYNHLR